MMSTSPTAVLRFASFELDPRSGELRKKGDLVPLRPQALRVLTVLAARSGEVVTRDEIRQQIWSEDTFVDFDQGLNLARLGDAAGALQLLERVAAGGFACYPALADDPWLSSLATRPAFKEVLDDTRRRHQAAVNAFAAAGGERRLGMEV
jgi:Transcriptional regulatory protein, C terminal